ncbi:hypothetical protein [Thermus altitudinis]|uniref:hypothetical protein n=1 Tax=Thermus altitudinis TaxID=2908145 RepID=UPI001FA95F5F|nr:hypothetical protein [Thermus altitudinis]
MQGTRWRILAWSLLALLPALGGCRIAIGVIGEFIPVLYEARGVCQGVAVTNHAEKPWEIVVAQRSGDPLRLPPGQTVRIPDPDPLPQKTLYVLNGPEGRTLGSPFSVDVSWHCLPDRPPERVSFTTTLDPNFEEGLVIVEDASVPSGLRIYRERRSSWRTY